VTILTPFVIDLILIGVVIEFVLLAYYLRRRGAASFIWPAGLFLASGLLLFLALRLVMTSAPQPLLGVTLIGAFISHILLIAWGLSRLNR